MRANTETDCHACVHVRRVPVTYRQNVVMAVFGRLMGLHPIRYRCFDPGPTNCVRVFPRSVLKRDDFRDPLDNCATDSAEQLIVDKRKITEWDLTRVKAGVEITRSNRVDTDNVT